METHRKAEVCVCVCVCRCSTASSRLAAYEVLVMLADSSLPNLQLITTELLSMHHQPDPSLSKEFDVRHNEQQAILHRTFSKDM